jgi:sulfotransferase family protein
MASTLPTFFLAGVPRAGTTSLHAYLAQHPQVFMSPVKEPHFFAAADLLARPDVVRSRAHDRAVLRAYLNGPQTRPVGPYVLEWEDYLMLFRNVRDETAIGEASVDYFVLPSAAPAIRSKLPEARLMFMLRDPAERLFSWYLMNLRRYPRTTFRAWLRTAMNPSDASWRAVDCGRYATHFERFCSIFPRDQMRIYLYEWYRADAGAVLRDMFEFIGVNPDRRIDVSRWHHETRVPRFPVLHWLRERVFGAAPMTAWLPAGAARALHQLYNHRREDLVMDPADRRTVVEYYRDEIVRTGDFIGRDLSAWLRA